jgi:hypothetical protein
MPSLSLTDIMYCTPEKKPTPVSASIFRLIWFSLHHKVVKRVRYRTERFHCLFGSTDGYVVSNNWVSLAALGYVGLAWVGLGWIGFGWVGLD